jgi:hypothetical protein
MTLVSGMGTFYGPVVGALIVISMQNYLAQFGEWVTVIQGVVFVACVLAFRRGRWRKRKGIARVRLSDGSVHVAEIHWYEAAGIGRKEFKIKHLL